MISKKNLEYYQGVSLRRGDDYIYLLPDVLLQPYISCYTITFPSNMSDNYSILPSASSTIVVSVNESQIISGLRGVNTKICNVGKYANIMNFLLLIEFHSGCLFPFIGVNQSEFTDLSFGLIDVDKPLMQSFENALINSDNMESLISSLNKILLNRLTDFNSKTVVSAIKNEILVHNGNISMSELASSFFYSEKHIRRLFLNYIGTSPKMFSRIVRVNYALQLMQNKHMLLNDLALQAGFFDQSHFINDFKSICSLTPHEYMRNMSDFYNDSSKF